MKKSTGAKSPLYDAGLIRAEMGKQRISGAQIERTSRRDAPPGLSVETITKVRAGRDVKVSTLKIVCEALGLELKIIERNAA